MGSRTTIHVTTIGIEGRSQSSSLDNTFNELWSVVTVIYQVDLTWYMNIFYICSFTGIISVDYRMLSNLQRKIIIQISTQNTTFGPHSKLVQNPLDSNNILPISIQNQIWPHTF